jgi:hypothetical protein
MHTLKLICLKVIKLAWLLPQSVATSVRHSRRQVILDAMEAERLDRIRHPSKYLGKS